MLKYHSTDNGNCRVYYKHGKRLVCFQEAGAGQFELLVCSRDGEPSHKIVIEGIVLDTLPLDDCSTSHAFHIWWTNNEALSQLGAFQITFKKVFP